MSFRTILKLLIPLLFSINIQAQNIKINSHHPDQYIVVKGDTLWDISGQFLEYPWQWVEIWENNPDIKDPNLIYPGDTLAFSMDGDKPRLRVSKRLSRSGSSNSVSKLSPQIRESPLDEAIKLIPVDAIAPFLTSPSVVNRDTLENSPYVIDFAGEHMIVGAGDRVYVRSVLSPESLSYTIYRAGETYTNHETKEILGYEAKYVADAILEKSGDPATLKIIKSNREVRKGDRLMLNNQDEVALNYFPRSPENPINGRIISVLDGVSQIGQHNIVVLDIGAADGIKVGHTFNIYHNGRSVKDPFAKQKNTMVKLPDEIAGILMVFRSFNRVSYALVMSATQSIHVHDKVRTH
jgi:hypothetical protein